MSGYKLIAFDMDGTLLNSKKQVTSAVIDGINKAFDMGKEVVLSTGRCLPELIEFFELIPKLRYAVAVSGGYVYDYHEHKIVYEKPIEHSVVLELLKFANHREDIMIHMLNEKSYIEKRCLENMTRYGMQPYINMFRNVATPVDNLLEYYKANPQKIHKINLYHSSPEDRLKTEAQLAGINAELTHSEWSSLECTAKGVTKGDGLIGLCNLLDIDISEAIAVGDSENDVGMLDVAGLAIGMGNSVESIKKHCDVFVADNNNDGALEAIEKFLL